MPSVARRSPGGRDTPGTSQPEVRVQILHVPGCTLLAEARTAVRNAISDTHIDVVTEEIEGDYPSPSILINGIDVAGAVGESGAACRLDVPTETQIRAKLSQAAGAP